MSTQEQKRINGKLVYQINFLGIKSPVMMDEPCGDIVIEETPGSITLTTRGNLLTMEKEMRKHWENQHRVAQSYKRQHKQAKEPKGVVPIYDAINPTVRITENGSLNYMNPEENRVMDSILGVYHGHKPRHWVMDEYN